MIFEKNLVPMCDGCLKGIPLKDECSVYPFPAAWERKGGCPMKTNKELEVMREGKKLNPIKASKRKNRK